MSENNTFDLFDWLETGTTATREVEIYNDHEAYQKLTALTTEFDELSADATLSLAQAARIAQLEDEIAVAREELAASKLVWKVRSLSEKEIQESLKAVPGPKMPTKPEGVMSDKVREKFEARAQAYGEAKVKADIGRKVWVVAKATTTLTGAAGDIKQGITVAELERLLDTPHGSAWIARVYQAVEDATTQEATPDFPS